MNKIDRAYLLWSINRAISTSRTLRIECLLARYADDTVYLRAIMKSEATDEDMENFRVFGSEITADYITSMIDDKIIDKNQLQNELNEHEWIVVQL